MNIVIYDGSLEATTLLAMVAHRHGEESLKVVCLDYSTEDQADLKTRLSECLQILRLPQTVVEYLMLPATPAVEGASISPYANLGANAGSNVPSYSELPFVLSSALMLTLSIYTRRYPSELLVVFHRLPCTTGDGVRLRSSIALKTLVASQSGSVNIRLPFPTLHKNSEKLIRKLTSLYPDFPYSQLCNEYKTVN